MSRLDQASLALEQSGILDCLQAYSPTVVSTLWVGLDIPGSDIDVICHYRDLAQFVASLQACCQAMPGYSLQQEQGEVTARCRLGEFPLEIYGATTPIEAQMGYRHFQVMRRLVALGGDSFVAAVRSLKCDGIKTEAAIARLLELQGDPFEAVAGLDALDDGGLRQLLHAERWIDNNSD